MVKFKQKSQYSTLAIKLISALISLLLFQFGVYTVSVSAQNTDSTSENEELTGVQKEIEELKKQIMLLQQQKNLIEAQRDLERTEELGDLKTEEEIIESETALEALKKARFETEKARIEAEKAAQNAQLPAFEKVTPLDGTTKIPEAGLKFESTILAYEALNQVSGSLYDSIKKLSGLKSLVIYGDDMGDNLIQILSNYRNYQTQIEILKLGYRNEGFTEPSSDLETLINKTLKESGETPKKESGIVGLGSAVTAVNAFLQAGVNIAALFRVNREIKPVTVTIPEAALVSQLAAKFKNNLLTTNNSSASSSQGNDDSQKEKKSSQSELNQSSSEPNSDLESVSSPGLGGGNNINPSDSQANPGLNGNLSDNNDKGKEKKYQCGVLGSDFPEIYYPKLYQIDIAEQQSFLSACQIELLNGLFTVSNFKEEASKKIAELVKKGAPNNTKLDENEKLQLARLRTLNQQFDTFWQKLINTSSDINLSPLAQLTVGAKIQNILQERRSYLMYVDIEAGGSNQTSRSLFGGGISHSGGVVVNYMIFDNRGVIKHSDICYYHTGFTKLKNPISAGSATNIPINDSVNNNQSSCSAK